MVGTFPDLSKYYTEGSRKKALEGYVKGNEYKVMKNMNLPQYINYLKGRGYTKGLGDRLIAPWGTSYGHQELYDIGLKAKEMPQLETGEVRNYLGDTDIGNMYDKYWSGYKARKPQVGGVGNIRNEALRKYLGGNIY